MAQLALPTLTAAAVNQVTNQEWADYRLEVDTYLLQEINAITTINPQYHAPVAPAEYTTDPHATTGRWDAANRMTVYLNNIHITHLTAVHTQALAAAAAAAPVATPPVAPPVVQPPNMQQLFQDFLNYQNQQAIAQAAVNNAAAARALNQNQVKTALPTKFTGITRDAQLFMNRCDNYFALNPMNDEQSI